MYLLNTNTQNEKSSFSTPDELVAILQMPIPAELQLITQELKILNELVNYREHFDKIIPDLNLRQKFVKRHGILFKREILIRAGLPIDNDSIEIIECAVKFLEHTDALKEILKEAKNKGIADAFKRTLMNEIMMGI